MNAPQLVDKFLHEQWYHIEADLMPHDKKQLVELLLTVWNGGCDAKEEQFDTECLEYWGEDEIKREQLRKFTNPDFCIETLPNGDKK